ncbi:MAG TPA: SDR family NAD(P)-dependent oxidoreductase [Vicinamibacterales bacterium]|nr:SDR family NAD(P)-dependent oxidoreductase [Vicinamibacterales bacterium]
MRALGLGALAIGAVMASRFVHRASRYSFRGRSVLITGASRGLGLELARQLAAEGARLWLVARSAAPLAAAAEELRAMGAVVDTIAADIRHPEDVERIIDACLPGDGVDVLINNAGMIEVSPFEHATTKDFEDSLATHFWGPLRLIRGCLPHMRRQGAGRIVNISSIGGRIAVPHLAAYAAGKFALTGLSETLHAELAKSGIAVTTVTPGLMRTGSYVNVRLRGEHQDELRWFTALSATPLTSMQTRRAAAQIVQACRDGRAAITPGWQARAAHLAAAVAPNSFARLNAAADRMLLPRPGTGPGADRARLAAEVDPGAVKTVLSEETRRRHHQPQPAW